MTASCDYDILIIGGGLVGASLACALGNQDLRIGVVEAVPFGADSQPSYDDRAIALAQGTRRIFAAMGVWEAMQAEVSPIHTIHVSDRGRFGFTRLERQQEGVEALGYVAPSRVMGAALAPRVAALSNVELLCPARLASLAIDAEGARAVLKLESGEREVSAKLVVAADGTRSAIREQFDLPVTEWEYGQTAVITNVTPQLAHAQVAYERFTDSGPLAMLPMTEGRCSVVWTLLEEQARQVMALDDADFLVGLQERFGYRLGRLEKVGVRHAYPLRMVRAEEAVQPRLALIGNAAHTLHPIAGQGFNLGLRDVAVLAEVLVDGQRAGMDIGDMALLEQYASWRRGDHRRVIGFTDGLARLFVNPLPLLGLVRDAGMVAMDLLPAAKHQFGRLTMGRAGRLPRLARGLPL